jgi:two-component system, LytTR family, response regulator
LNIRTLIIEDEPLARQTLRDFIADFAWLELVGEAADGLTATKIIDELKPDLIFLDVQIPEISGLETLNRITHQPSIVFTTAFDNFALKAFEFEAIDYLQKPFGRERFRQTVERVKKQFQLKISDAPKPSENAPLERLFVRERNRIFPLQISQIVWIEANDDYATVHTAEKSFLVSLTLGEFAKRLDANKFLRVHRSAIINLDHISQIEEFDRRLLVYMQNGAEVQASRTGSQLLKKLIA